MLCGEAFFILINSWHSVCCKLCVGFCARQRHGTALARKLCASSSLRNFTAVLDIFFCIGSGGKKTEHVCTAKANFSNLVNLTVPMLCKPRLL